MSGKVVVVGGGVAGLCCAYYLRRLGEDVTVVESNRVGSGASFANGGWLCPAQAGPLPEPGLTLYGMRALFDRDSALYFKPGDWHRLAPWLLRFRTYCNEEDHAHGTAAIARLGQDVFDLVEEMRADGVEFELHKQGMVYAARSADDARARAPQARPDARLRLRPARRRAHRRRAARARAGARADRHARASSSASTGTSAPDTFTAGLAAVLRRDGVEIQEGAEVFELVREGRRLTHVRTAAGDIEAGTVVLAAGSWTTPLAALDRHPDPDGARQGLQLLGAARRWCRPTPSSCSTCTSAARRSAIACASAGRWSSAASTTGSTGAGSPRSWRARRQSFLPWESPEIESEWAGMRPITADGLPVLDRAGDLDNAYIATGYAMQGVTLAPIVRAGPGRDDHHRPPPAAARAVPARPLRPRAARPRGAPHPRPQPGMSPERARVRVAIIGTGNIGTDLMIKVERSPLLELVGMAGIDPDSDGLRRARERGHTVTHRGLADLLDQVADIDLAFDATSAGAHPEHARLLAERGITSVDLTPAALGPAVVPPVNLSEHADAAEVTLITCGAQATIPIVAAISRVARMRYAETVSTVASRSAGPGHAPEHRRVHRGDGPRAWRRSAERRGRRPSSS